MKDRWIKGLYTIFVPLIITVLYLILSNWNLSRLLPVLIYCIISITGYFIYSAFRGSSYNIIERKLKQLARGSFHVKFEEKGSFKGISSSLNKILKRFRHFIGTTVQSSEKVLRATRDINKDLKSIKMASENISKTMESFSGNLIQQSEKAEDTNKEMKNLHKFQKKLLNIPRTPLIAPGKWMK